MKKSNIEKGCIYTASLLAGLLLALALLTLSGCVAVGDNARVQMFERAEANASLAASLGSRTQAGSATSKEGQAEGTTESLTEGGGTLELKDK
jgi:outer membrane lipoprotein-sorting protein